MSDGYPDEGQQPSEDWEDGWKEAARMFARNADYWRGRAEAAERWYPVAWFRRLLRWFRNNVTGRVSFP